MASQKDFLGRGYFPRELPPPFTTQGFAEAVVDRSDELPRAFLDRTRVSKVEIHNLPLVGRLKRPLGIPNPVHQFRLSSEICENWDSIAGIIRSDRLALSVPCDDSTQERAVTRAKTFQDLPQCRAEVRATSKYVLLTDVARFYASIYTHSIPWAAHGKAKAKTDHGDSLFGNRLDKCIRDGQDRQTVGIPIGPDTSFVIAEMILAKVDSEFCRGRNIRGFRYVDDYELSFETLGEAEEALAALEECLGKYELSLNPAKTEILELPAGLETPWASELRVLRIRETARHQCYDLLRFFERGFTLAKRFSEGNVLKFCVSRLYSTRIVESNWKLVHDLLLQCMIAEPGLLPNAIRVFLKQRQSGARISPERLKAAFKSVLMRRSQARHGSEVAWAIWGSILFGLTLDEDATSNVARMPDSVVALLLLDARDRGLVQGNPDLNLWRSLMTKQELQEKHWLLAYEASVKDWLASSVEGDYIGEDEAFSYLRDKNVVFYEIVDPSKATEEHRASAPSWVSLDRAYP